MTIFYPDISSFQSGIDLRNTVAVCCKVTEGTNYANPDYGRAKANAASHGVFFFAYHFLHRGNAAAQARWCYQHVGSTPVMVDVEPTTGSSPTLFDVAEFIAEFRALGGVVHMVYLPHWYWQQIGSPALTALKNFALALVSSNYSSFASGAGWAGYGGMTPKVWQYTDRFWFNGHLCDFNAYKGTVAQLKSIVRTGKLPAPVKPSKAVNPVQNLWAVKRYTQANIGWNKATGATSYRVIVKQGLKQVQEHEVTGNKLTLRNLRMGTRHTVTVLALPAKLSDSVSGRARVSFTTNK